MDYGRWSIHFISKPKVVEKFHSTVSTFFFSPSGLPVKFRESWTVVSLYCRRGLNHFSYGPLPRTCGSTRHWTEKNLTRVSTSSDPGLRGTRSSVRVGRECDGRILMGLQFSFVVVVLFLLQRKQSRSTNHYIQSLLCTSYSVHLKCEGQEPKKDRDVNRVHEVSRSNV